MIREKRLRQAEDAAIRWLVRLTSPDFTERQKEEFFLWLNASPLHQAAYIKAEELWQRGGALQHVKDQVSPRAFTQPWSWALATACVALMAALFFLRGPKTEHYSAQTSVGEQKQLVLSDGSKLTLNTNSEVRVELQAERRITYLLRGEVFFDVSRDEQRPFDVYTNDGVVRVLGTQFAVRATGSDSTVTVLEGKVGLSKSVAEGNFEPAVILTANQQLNLRRAEPGIRAQAVDAAASLSWREQQLVYRGQALQQVVDDLNRYFPTQIVLADHSLNDIQVSAVLRLKTADNTAQALAEALGLQLTVDQKGETLILHQPK